MCFFRYKSSVQSVKSVFVKNYDHVVFFEHGLNGLFDSFWYLFYPFYSHSRVFEKMLS